MQITNILLPIDGSDYSVHATDYAIHLAKLLQARVTAVCCYQWFGYLPEMTQDTAEELKASLEQQAAEILKKTEKTMKEGGVNYTVRTILGSPGKILPNLAKSKEFDLIVMGSHGHSDISGLFLGSVTHKVLNTIYCPVLVVP